MCDESTDHVVLKEQRQNRIEDFDEDDDDIRLPADTLAILNEFLRERSDNQTENTSNGKTEIKIEEDWQLSQFWYNGETKQALSRLCLKLILQIGAKSSQSEVRVGLLSCPSLYNSIKNVHSNGIVRIFEYDNRFAVFNEDFVQYDYRCISKQIDYLDEYKEFFDIIIADPPFLSKECIENTSKIINKLKKVDAKVILCSGQTVSEHVKEFMDLNQCQYRPQHERNLANEFCSYANFPLDELLA